MACLANACCALGSGKRPRVSGAFLRGQVNWKEEGGGSFLGRKRLQNGQEHNVVSGQVCGSSSLCEQVNRASP